MGRILNVMMFTMLFAGGSSFVNSWGLWNYQSPTSPQWGLPNVIVNSGCTTYSNQTTHCAVPTLSGSGSSVWQSLLTFGDYFGAMTTFVSTFGPGLVVPGYFLLAYGVPSGLVVIIAGGVYFSYFVFLMFFLRGNRPPEGM